MKLIARGSECLRHMLDLARKYSDIEDRDRCMILRSNALLTIIGLLELHRSVLGEGAVATAEECLESRQKCEELLTLLASTSRQTMEEDGQRLENFIMVFPLRWLSLRLADYDLSMITTEIRRRTTLKQSSPSFQLAVSQALSYHSPRRASGSLTNALWNGS